MIPLGYCNVFILDREAPTESFTLREIVKVKTDEDKMVKNVALRYEIKILAKVKMTFQLLINMC